MTDLVCETLGGAQVLSADRTVRTLPATTPPRNRFIRPAKNCSQSVRWQTTSRVLHLPGIGRERSISPVMPETAARRSATPWS